MKPKDFTESQRNLFATVFYDNFWPLGEREDLDDNPLPWGMPWLWKEDKDIYGDTIEEMAENHWIRHANEISEYILQERINQLY